MMVLYAILEVAGRLGKRELKDVKNVGILFLKPLGIGDLIMLSPVIQATAELFSLAEIELITWVPEIISLNRIKWVNPEEVGTHRYDLVISPALNLRHLKYIRRAKYWLGYFAKSKIQSNFGASGGSYDMARGHYLWRGVQLIKSLDAAGAAEIERKFNERLVDYPPIICEEPHYFKAELLGSRYAVVSVFLKLEDRQWPLEKCAKVIKESLRHGYFDKVVLIGDSSAHNLMMSKKMKEILNFSPHLLIDTTGKNNLKETSFLIKNSSLFFGLDSAPAHIAYELAPKAVVVFITVAPRFRIPFLADIHERVRFVYPDTVSSGSLYSGLRPVPLNVARKYMRLITVEKVMSTISGLMEVNYDLLRK